MFMKIIRGIWRGLDRLRRVLHLIVLLMLFAVVLAALVPETPVVPDSAALLLAPEGALVEQLSGDAFDLAVAKARGLPMQETLMKDLVDAIRLARDDDRIKTLVLQLDGLTGAGLSKLQDLAAEIAEFKKSGKPVIAFGSGFDQSQYFLAAQADEVYMHPMGAILLDGYSRFLPYYKSALDKLSVDYRVWTAGQFKSVVEPYTRDDMSDADKIASGAYLSALWNAYQADVTAARNLSGDSLQRYADNIVALLDDAGGDTAKLALDYGLVDGLWTRDRMRERLRELAGNNGDDGDGYSGIGLLDYLAAVRGAELPRKSGSKIAVIVASGEILDGNQPPGSVGGDSMARLIRRAADDDDVEALVLRVDSPGGSAFASDVILRELEVFQATDRPIVVSMGSVAASGGYWISMSADEIWASPTTLTGSIGVAAAVPTFPRTLDRVGVHVDGIGTTSLSGQFDTMRGIGDDAAAILAATVASTYDKFVGKVAGYRGRSVDEIEQVAQGRVWAGSDALPRGLVDRLGSLDDAIASSASLAGLAEGEYHVEYFAPELSVSERLLLELFKVAAPAISAIGLEPRIPAALSRLIDAASEPLAFLERFNDPRGIYAYCFCDVR
jgi:protease IV